MPDPGDRLPGRLVALLGAAVLAVAAIGLVTGMEPNTYRAKRPPVREQAISTDIPPARTHAELERRPWGSGPDRSGWLDSLKIAAAAAKPPPSDLETTLAQAVRARSLRRAFDGAPPTVPHPIRASGAAECLACHADGFQLGGRRASPVPHERYASCTQCHVSSEASFRVVSANPAAAAPSSWRGLVSAEGGPVAYPGAPPAVPHSTRMRERCDSCHGAEGWVALRTPHPARRSCLQCHPAIGGRGAVASR
jgi:cytochrome c-type protein NapB